MHIAASVLDEIKAFGIYGEVAKISDTEYKITKGGNYRVTFNANISSDATGLVAFALFMDGVELPGTRVMQEVTTAGVYQNVAFNKIVPICYCGNGTLTIQSVPTVLSGATGAVASVETQVPTIQI